MSVDDAVAQAAPGQPTAAKRASTLTQRFALRLCIAFFTVEFLPLLLFIPGEVGVPTPTADWIHDRILALGGWLLRIETYPPATIAEFKAQMVGCLVIAAAITVAWLALDRRPRNEALLHDRLRIVLRYMLGFSMCMYGGIKILPSQFGPPSLDILLRPVGQLNPMLLMWNFMGFSTAYVIFSGILELTGAVLLFFRRTTTLGALILLAVLSNVVVMNFAYNVNVKIPSVSLWLMALVLLVPELPRVMAALVSDYETGDAPPPMTTGSRGKYRVRVATKSIAIATFTIVPFIVSFGSRQSLTPSTGSAFHGAYDVDVFVRNGDTIRVSLTDTTRWRRIIRDDYAFVSIQRSGDDAAWRIWVRDDSANKRLVLRNMPDSVSRFALTYRIVDTTHVALDGVVNHEPVHALLRRIDVASLPLLRPYR